MNKDIQENTNKDLYEFIASELKIEDFEDTDKEEIINGVLQIANKAFLYKVLELIPEDARNSVLELIKSDSDYDEVLQKIKESYEGDLEELFESVLKEVLKDYKNLSDSVLEKLENE